MSLSVLDAFGAQAAPGAPPGAPPVSALAGEGSPIDGGDGDGGFVALLEAAAAEPSAGEAADAAADSAFPIDAALAADPALAALQAKLWLAGLALPRADAPAEGAGSDPDVGDPLTPSDAAADPDDHAAAEFFIASGAVLTALVVDDEAAVVPMPETVGDPEPDGEIGAAGEPVGSDSASAVNLSSPANPSSPAYAVAAGARHDAGVRRAGETPVGQPSNDIAAAAHAHAAERRASRAAAQPAPAGGGAPVTEHASAPGGSTPAGESPAADRVMETTAEFPSQAQLARSERAATNVSQLPALAASASEVAKAVTAIAANTEGAGRADVAALAAASGQAVADDRRSIAAAARLASGLERGGGATAVPSSAVSGYADPGSDPGNAVQPVDPQAHSDAGSDQQPAESRENRLAGDALLTPAMVRTPPVATTAGDTNPVVSAPPVPQTAAAMPAMAAAVAAPLTTPDAETLPQLVQAIRMQYRAGGGDAVVRLNPEHLGAVQITLRVERGVVSATVHAESPVVRQWLEEQASSLREGLSGQGLHLDRFVVQRDGRQAEQRHHEDAQPRRRRMPRHQPGDEQATFEVRV